MTVIYIDRVFALNLALDYMLLLICARLAGTPLRRLRFLLCAAGGALYAAAVFLPGCAALNGPVFRLLAGPCEEPCGLLVRGAALAADRAVFPRQRGARGTAACRRACARLTGEAPRAGVLCPRQLAGAAGDSAGNELAAAAGVRPGGASWRE